MLSLPLECESVSVPRLANPLEEPLKENILNPYSDSRLLKSSAAYFAALLTNVSIEANSVDQDQTAPTGAVCFGSTLFVEEASKTIQQTTKADDLCCDWR